MPGESRALTELRHYLTAQEVALNSRLPPERDLCGTLGVSRSNLRQALAVLEAEGQVWRHVGRGTFVGARPVLNLNDVTYLSGESSPAAVMEARLAIEPQLARLAALHATNADFSQIRACIRASRSAREWRVYEAWDNKLHRAIAGATHNKLLISLFDTLNTVRRSTVWGQLRSTKLPPADHHSFAEHDCLYDAISQRDAELAVECMRRHLRSVRDRVLASLDA